MIIRDLSEVDIDVILKLAEEAGFSQYAALDMDALVFRPEVREMCSADKCRNYGKNWACPPAAGSLELITKRAAGYRNGVIVQTTGALESDFDMDSIRRIMADHKRRFQTLVRQTRMLSENCLPMGAGACTACRSCTYPDRPCRHPDRMYPSMEAYGLLVSDVCLRSGLEYNYGKNTMTYTSCVLFNTRGERDDSKGDIPGTDKA